jgi:hypothetical protein
LRTIDAKQLEDLAKRVKTALTCGGVWQTPAAKGRPAERSA